MSARRGDAPRTTVAKLRAICERLPSSVEEDAWVGRRWKIGMRTYAHVLAIEAGWPPAYARAAGTDGPAVVLTVRAAGDLYDTLRTAGPPYFQPVWGTMWGTKVIGIHLDGKVDWDEVAVVVGESYRLLATPNKKPRSTSKLKPKSKPTARRRRA